jgi:hypothetical protein
LPMFLGVALGFGLSAPAWLAILDLVQGSARELQPASTHWQWIVPHAALPAFILPCWTVNWSNFSSHYLPHTGTELACGLVAPVALIAGFIWHGRMLVLRLKWELTLLVVVLVLATLPTAGLFRWSFRWLPFVHLILAICAAEVLQICPASSTFAKATADKLTPAITAVAIVILTAAAMLAFHTNGSYAFPLTWIFLGLGTLWCLLEFILRHSGFHGWTPGVITFLVLLITYVCIPPNGGVPKYNLSQELLKPSPLDPHRLYLSIYPWAEQFYRIEEKPQPVGQILRLGSTSMWAGLRFINGYSPIRPAGVAREFHTAIHGEIDPTVAEYLLNDQAGADGELARLGVDGIVVMREMDFASPPASEWEQVVSTDEGRMFHRRGAPFARVRSVPSIDSRPNEQFVSAKISRVNDSRNRVEADIDVPAGDQPTLLSFSRPYFRGYQAQLGNQKLTVSSYRGLFPLVEVPANAHGQLILVYRPSWLIWGGSAAVACALAVVLGFCAAIYQRR